MAQLRRIVGDPTTERVAALAREARIGGPAGMPGSS